MATVLKYLPRFRNLQKQLRSLSAREDWTREQLAAFQLRRLNQLWLHAQHHVAYYCRLRESHRLPREFRSLQEFSRRMPLLSKSVVRAEPSSLLADKTQPGSWHRTGGSTGTPTAVYWERAAHREMLRCKYRSEQAWGLEVLDRKVFFWGHSGSFAPGMSGIWQRWQQPLVDRLRNRLRLSAYQLGQEQLLEHLRKIQQFQPRSIYGYSSAVDVLAQAAADHGISLPSLRVAILTAEPADPAMLQAVSENLGVPAVIEYGAVECGLLAYMMPDGTIRTRDDVALIETVPSEQGNYDIVVTVLNNGSFPLIRYRIEDNTSQPIARPARGFGVLADVLGRSNDMVVSKSGRFVHSMAIKHILEHWPEIRRFSARQDAGGTLRVSVEQNSQLSAGVRQAIYQRLCRLLEGYEVHVDCVERIPGNLAGKHRWIVSERAEIMRAARQAELVESRTAVKS